MPLNMIADNDQLSMMESTPQYRTIKILVYNSGNPEVLCGEYKYHLYFPYVQYYYHSLHGHPTNKGLSFSCSTRPFSDKLWTPRMFALPNTWPYMCVQKRVLNGEIVGESTWDRYRDENQIDDSIQPIKCFDGIKPSIDFFWQSYFDVDENIFFSSDQNLHHPLAMRQDAFDNWQTLTPDEVNAMLEKNNTKCVMSPTLLLNNDLITYEMYKAILHHARR